jgi:hypothetical protein
MNANFSSSTAMSAGDTPVELIVKFSVRGKTEPHKILGTRKVKVIESVSCACGVHDTVVNFTPAPSIQRLTSSKYAKPTKLLGKMLEDSFDVMDEPIPYDDWFREALEELPQRVELLPVDFVPLVLFVVDGAIRHLEELAP